MIDGGISACGALRVATQNCRSIMKSSSPTVINLPADRIDLPHGSRHVDRDSACSTVHLACGYTRCVLVSINVENVGGICWCNTISPKTLAHSSPCFPSILA